MLFCYLYIFLEKLEFQAETRMLLDIVAKSLYSEKEVCDSLQNNLKIFVLQLV